MPLNNQGAQTFHCSLCALKKLAASPGAWPNPTIQRIVAMLPPRLLSNGLMSPPHFVSTPNVRIFYWGLTSQAAAWWSNSVCHPSIASPFEQRTFVRHIFFFLSYYKIISALTYPLRPQPGGQTKFATSLGGRCQANRMCLTSVDHPGVPWLLRHHCFQNAASTLLPTRVGHTETDD